MTWMIFFTIIGALMLGAGFFFGGLLYIAGFMECESLFAFYADGCLGVGCIGAAILFFVHMAKLAALGVFL